jgi:hypothetical protein
MEEDLARTAQKTHSVSVTKTSQLLLYWEIIAVCSEIHTKHINTLCGQNVEFVNVEPGGTYSDHWAVNGSYAMYVKRKIYFGSSLSNDIDQNV